MVALHNRPPGFYHPTSALTGGSSKYIQEGDRIPKAALLVADCTSLFLSVSGNVGTNILSGLWKNVLSPNCFLSWEMLISKTHFLQSLESI